MSLPAGEVAQGLRSTHVQPRSPFTLPLSIGAHIVVIYAVSQAPWAEVEAPSGSSIRVAWVTMPRAKDLPEPPPAEAAPADPIEEAAEAATPADSPPDSPEEAIEPAPPAEEPSAPAKEPSIPAPAPRARVDWERARQDAVSATLDARQRESRFRTFSAGDHIVIEEPEEPSPRAEMFNSRTPSHSFAKPGQQRTKVGRWLAKSCNMLSGGGFGINLFGYGFGGTTFCAPGGGDGGLFADIEPDYLKYLPVCFDAGTTPQDGVPAGPLRDPATAKCRLGPAEP